MFNILPTRKIYSVLGKHGTKRNRGPVPLQFHTLTECLEDRPSRRLRKFWFFILLLLPATYFLIVSWYLSRPRIYSYTQFYVTEEDEGKNLSTTTTEEIRVNRSELPTCLHAPLANQPTEYYASRVNTSFDRCSLDTAYPEVLKGGWYIPEDCVSRHKVGIIVPYRDRQKNLLIFLFNIHPFLMRQKLEYRVFIVEQYGKELFNMGRIYNAGLKEIQKLSQWKCIIFHDVDLLPMDARNLYTCPYIPRHMCGSVQGLNQDSNYLPLFGGVTCMSPVHFIIANGYSNMYWGWGGEDNDMFLRLRASKLPIVRYKKNVAVYMALPHAARQKNINRYKLISSSMTRFKDDGLSTVEYRLVKISYHHLYTHIVVDINPYGNNITGIMEGV